MARPRSSEHARRETAFRTALIQHRGDVEQAQAAAGIAPRHVVRLLNESDWLALVHALKTGAVGPTAVTVEPEPYAQAA